METWPQDFVTASVADAWLAGKRLDGVEANTVGSIDCLYSLATQSNGLSACRPLCLCLGKSDLTVLGVHEHGVAFFELAL